MNILPKKSWHVRNKRNIERVRRDEEKARQEEEEKQKRIDLAEKEARLEILRKRARLRGKEESEDESTINDINKPKEKNVNFFEQDNTATTNSEYESEKKAEQERLEKKLGILTYLGQSAIESQNRKPWYCDDERSKTLEEKASQRDKKLKDSMDPLNDIKKYLNVKKNSNDKDNPEPTAKKTASASSKTSHGTKTMEELRAQRIRRERGERQREQELLKRIHGVKDNSDQKRQAAEPYRKYNSQFHPEYARQSKNRYHDLP